jgi:hypothetical protein
MSLDSFSTDGDWIRIKVKFPGKCIKCNKKLDPGNFCYWSRASKAILHEDCYQLGHSNKSQISPFNGDTNLPSFKSKKSIPKINSNTKKRVSTKCIICSDVIDIHNELIAKLGEIWDNKGEYEGSYCVECMVNFDDVKYELYKKEFMRKIQP